MLSDISIWQNLMIMIGEATVIIIVGMFILSFLVVGISFYSIKNGQFYFPTILKPGLVMTEGFAKGICRFFGLDDQELVTFFIRLHNKMNTVPFSKIPFEKRAIFLPQCLRNSSCPAHLTPEGLVCRRCGRCEIGAHIDELESLGYRVWIAPGSTLIKRMVKKYKPEGIIGVGCLMEVKEGLELTDKMTIVGMGVLTATDGCVETTMNWNDLLEVAVLSSQE